MGGTQGKVVLECWNCCGQLILSEISTKFLFIKPIFFLTSKQVETQQYESLDLKGNSLLESWRSIPIILFWKANDQSEDNKLGNIQEKHLGFSNLHPEKFNVV